VVEKFSSCPSSPSFLRDAAGLSFPAFDAFDVELAVGGSLADEMQADWVLRFAGAEEVEDAFAVAELALEVFVGSATSTG